MEKVGIENRYGICSSVIEKINDDEYYWYPTEDSCYFRISKDKEKINFIDPDGGPMLYKGSKINISKDEIRVIDDIKETEDGKYIIVFEK